MSCVPPGSVAEHCPPTHTPRQADVLKGVRAAMRAATDKMCLPLASAHWRADAFHTAKFCCVEPGSTLFPNEINKQSSPRNKQTQPISTTKCEPQWEAHDDNDAPVHSSCELKTIYMEAFAGVWSV